MLQDKINKLIVDATMAKDRQLLEVLRSIKASFLNWKTAKENVGKELTESDEIQILKKMVKQRKDSIDQFNLANRKELAESEQYQIDVIQQFLPKEATEEEIIKVFDELKLTVEPIKKNMGSFIKGIKERLSNADNKMISEIVKSKLI